MKSLMVRRTGAMNMVCMEQTFCNVKMFAKMITQKFILHAIYVQKREL